MVPAGTRQSTLGVSRLHVLARTHLVGLAYPADVLQLAQPPHLEEIHEQAGGVGIDPLDARIKHLTLQIQVSAEPPVLGHGAREDAPADRGARHIAFAVIPGPVPAPGNGQTVGIDRGVAVSAALSTGEMLHCPALTARERTRLRRMQRKLARAARGSNRRGRVKHAIARLRARETDRRKDWAEKTSTGIARRFDLIRVEDLKIGNMTRSATGTRDNPGRNVSQKAGLNRGILRSGWGLLVRRLEDKALGRVEKVRPALTSQRCSACGEVDRDSRESQAVFRCTACGFAGHADVNAAISIAAGHAVTARGGDGVARPVNREPQLLLPSA